MNLDHPILSSDGKRYYGFGGELCHKRFEAHGYECSLEWFHGKPTMCIWSSRRGPGSGVFGFSLGEASYYCDPKGDITPLGYLEVIAALPDMGRPSLEIEAKTLAKCVELWVTELLHMPPEPPDVSAAKRPAPLWEITHKDQNGKVLSEASI